MEGKLKKMVIEAYKEADYSGSPAQTFTVMFNPNTYTQKYEVEYEARQGQGDSGSPQVFGSIKPQEYNFEFLFDGTGTAADKVEVQDVVEAFLTVTGKLDGAVGGDSESAIYAQAMFLRHIGDNKHFDIGYRYYDVDYESGSGLTRFKWDVAQSGPIVGFSWEFGR